MSAPGNTSGARAMVWDVAGIREACEVMPEVAWNRMTLDLLDVVEAADCYANWHDPRIVPTAEWPDQDVALKRLRACLERFGLSFQSPLTASDGSLSDAPSGGSDSSAAGGCSS